MPLTHYEAALNSAPVDPINATKQLTQIWRALTAIANGLDELDAQLLYGFTEEELAAYRLAWNQAPHDQQ